MESDRNLKDYTQDEMLRLEWMIHVAAGGATISEASSALQLSTAQTYRVFNRYCEHGADGLRHKLRGRPGNRAYPASFKQEIVELVAQKYPDFGPTLIRKMLKKYHDVDLAISTIRRWLIADRIWHVDRLKRRKIHRLRKRSARYGQQIQIDGSRHRWFENRAPECVLMIHVDDSTGQILHGQFFTSETANAYLETTRACVSRWGKPISIVTDRHAGVGDDFLAALAEIGTIHIFANCPQSKGRVERMNRTLQDRLVKEMRIEQICSLGEANAFLPRFLNEFNAEFGKQPESERSGFRPIADYDDLNLCFAKRYKRKVSRQLSFSLNGIIYSLEDTTSNANLAGKTVDIRITPEGKMLVISDGVGLNMIAMSQINNQLRDFNSTLVPEISQT